MLVLALAGLAAIAGCASPGRYEVEPWAEGPAGSRTLRTEHYAIHTTLADAALRDDVAETLERSRKLYDQLADAPDDAELAPADAYVFAYREEWAEHTRRTAGARAPLFLNISRGGYAENGSFSTFFSGSTAALLATCRHEGLHQHIERTYATRPPPFLEEGLATLFEEGFDGNDLSRPLPSFERKRRLRDAVRRRRAWPLDELLQMHAGHVVGADDYRQVRTFYAQAWGFAHFLASEHEPGLRKLMTAYAGGYAPANIPAAFEESLGMNPRQLELAYEAHVRDLVGLD